MAWSVQIGREAGAALKVLAEGDRAAVERVIGRLVLGPAPMGFPEALPLDEASGHYAVRAGQKYWITYSIEPDDVIIVDDILSQETIQKYFAPAAR